MYRSDGTLKCVTLFSFPILTAAFYTDSGAHPASYPMGTRGSFPGVKRPGREADHSPPYSAEVKNVWSYTSTPTTPSCCGAQLKHRDNFAFYKELRCMVTLRNVHHVIY
jgi:hypothetical protein